LSAANAHISSLEAELKVSRTAWDVAAAAKTAAEKSTKSAVAKAKKAEKALADADRERVQREQAITKCLNQISALAGGKYHAFPFLADLLILILTDVCSLIDEGMTDGPPTFAYLVFGPGRVSLERLSRPIKAMA
jgi:hypothetical protein